MKESSVIFEQGNHKWVVLHQDIDKAENLIDTNEYLISNNDKLLLLDPGGMEIFPSVLAALSNVIDIKRLDTIFSSHQDPDVISSLPLWLEVNPDIKCYVPQIWVDFIAGFGGGKSSLVPVPDQGTNIKLDDITLKAIPAHYLHSSGNFNLYDAKAKILFSGDIGGALIPNDKRYLFVDDFDQHVKYIEHFHQRWFGSSYHKKRWCEYVMKLDLDFLCPQHGSIYKGKNIKRFLEWFYELEIALIS